MSCRVVPAANRRRAEPLKLPYAGWVEPQPEEIVPPEPLRKAHPEPSAEQVEETRALRARVVELERQLQKEVAEARKTGYREGEKAGREVAVAEVKPVMDRLLKSLEELATVRGRLRRETEADLVRLSIAIARRVLHREIAVDPDAIRSLIKTVLERVQARDIIRINTHPEDEGVIRQHFKSSLASSHIEVISNPALSRGALVVETSRGELDASVDTQLDEIERGFADRIRS